MPPRYTAEPVREPEQITNDEVDAVLLDRIYANLLRHATYADVWATGPVVCAPSSWMDAAGGGGVPAGARLLTIVTMVAHVAAVVVPQRGAVAARIVKESAVRIKQTSLSTAQIQGTWDACTAPVPHATAWGRWAVGGAGCPF